MSPTSDALVRLVWTQVWQLTVVAIVIGLLVKLVGRRRPHLAYILWMVVLVKGLTPPIWSSPTSVFSWTAGESVVQVADELIAVPAKSVAVENPAQALGTPIAAESGSPFEVTANAETRAAQLPAESSLAVHRGPPAVNSASPQSVLVGTLGIVWLAGAVTHATCAAAAVFRLGRVVKHRQVPLESRLAAVMATLSQRLHVRQRVRLSIVDAAVGPLTLGWLRPVIVLPLALAEKSDEELEPVLAHELLHVRRGDAVVGLLQVVLQSLWWFHPLVWWTNRGLCFERERCCDEEVVAELAYEPSRYGRSLLGVLDIKRQLRLPAAIPGIRSFEVTRARLEYLAKYSKSFRRRMPRGYWVALLLAVVFVAPGAGWSGFENHGSAAYQPETVTDGDTAERPFEFRLKVVGPDGTHVPNTNLEIRTTPAPTADQIQRGKFVRKSNYGALAQTDDEGRLTVTLPRRPERFTVKIEQPGFGPYSAGWDSTSHEQRIPQDFTAELEEGWSVGGVIVDASGQPVVGAKVRPSVEYKKRPDDHSQLGVGTRIATDAKGQWRFDCVPASMSDVRVEIHHPDYQPLRQRLARQGFEIQQGSEPTSRLELQRGLTVTGTVIDESGKPIAGAVVRTKFSNDVRKARTDEQGGYRLIGCEPRMARIVVSATGQAMDMQEVRVDQDMPPVNFSMKPGGKIRIRVVDEQGKGIAKARIFFQGWRGQFDYFEFDHVGQYADENGVWVWNEAPLDSFQADICRPGGMQLPRQSLVAREEEYVFTPLKALVVSGSIIDAKTKAPIQKFQVIPGLRNRDPRIRMNWIPRDSYEGTGGKYQIRLTHGHPAHLVRIEAEGYQVAISRDFMTDEGEVHYDFELQPAEDIAATVLAATGEPAANAKVAIGVAGSQISISQGDIDDTSTYATRIDTDAVGRFSVPARDEPFQLVVTHPLGFAHLSSADGPIPDPIKLTTWARVEGTFRVGPQPGGNVVLSLFGDGIHSYGDDVPNIFTHHDVTTGKDGQFVFARVFPGTARIGRRILLIVDEGATEVTSSQRVSATFVSGETTTIHLGGTGRTVIGKLVPRAENSERPLWNFGLVEVRANLSPPPSPTAPNDIQGDPDKRAAWWIAWKATDEGLAWDAAYQIYQQLESKSPYVTASVARDGSFRIDDMPAGDYLLNVSFSKQAPGHLRDYRFSVPEAEVGNPADPVDLGVLNLQ